MHRQAVLLLENTVSELSCERGLQGREMDVRAFLVCRTEGELYCLVIGDLYMCFAQSIDVQLPVLARAVIPYCYNFSCETCKWSICMCVCVFITIKYVKWLIFFQLLDAVN